MQCFFPSHKVKFSSFQQHFLSVFSTQNPPKKHYCLATSGFPAWEDLVEGLKTVIVLLAEIIPLQNYRVDLRK